MTNEELAIQIQLGHTEHYAELWQNVRQLMYKILHRKISRLELPNYIAVEDMEQELYFALCNAVQAYDDTKPYRFTSYLTYHIMNAVRFALPRKPLQEYSYNQAIDDSEETELIDLIPDSTAAEKIQDIELTDIQMQTRQAVSELPDRERQAITLYYFKNINQLTKIANLMKISPYKVKNSIDKGLYILRQNNALQAIYGEMKRHYTHNEYVYQQCAENWELSRERREVKKSIEKMRLDGNYISYRDEQNILRRAEEKYIREHADSLNIFYHCQ